MGILASVAAVLSLVLKIYEFREKKNQAPTEQPAPETIKRSQESSISGNQNIVTQIDRPTGPVNIFHGTPFQSDSYSMHVQGTALSSHDLKEARKFYLNYLIERYQYLELKGMGVSDRVPLKLRLQDVYVPLLARVELPRGETWERVKVSGRQVPEEERDAIAERLSEPKAVVELLENQRGLIILGDPGAGKTTFLKWLTIKLAQSDKKDGRLPILVPLSSYADTLSKNPHTRLDDFISDYFHQQGVDVPMKSLLSKAIANGNALIMLDGLDEVRDLSLRTTVVNRVIAFYDFHKAKGNKFLLTSRIIGYRDVRPTATDLLECTLEDFNDEQIEAFVEGWTKAIEAAARGEGRIASQEADRERKELMEAVERNPGVRRLAANPLLLTILALMKRQGVRLPERRVELYEKYVETLLSSWNRARGLGRPPSRDLDVVETVRLLAPLALWMHEENPGVGLVKQADLLQELIRLYEEKGEAEPESCARQFIKDVREFSGLLLERGAGQYGFIHLTFEEYLAAVGIAQNAQESIQPVVEALAKHIGDDNWREVSLLTIGYLGIVQQRERAASAVVRELIKNKPGKPGEAAVLSGDAVYDAWPGGVTRECRNEVVEELLRVMRDSKTVEPYWRVTAGNTLAKLGDPRFREDAWFLPKDELLGFIHIPAGKFKMGSDKKADSEAYDDELDLHEIDLPEYYIGRWPVTVAQFRAFLKEHEPENLEAYKGIANHPVTNVSWYLALKYCDWLTEKLRDWPELPAELAALVKEKGWIVTLPSEAEWEKAARGADGRIYPWGNDDPEPNRANYGETGINATSPVGCFPDGASPYGCEDMAGNVWEWTRSLWGENPDKPKFRYPYDSGDGREDLHAPDSVFRVVRGGAFLNDSRILRCAVRNRNHPYYWYGDQGFRVALRPPLGSEPSGL